MENLSRTKAFITGINGFTGKYLARYLQTKGWNIIGLSNSTSSLEWTCLIADISEIEKIAQFLANEKPDYIFHLAGLSFVDHKPEIDFYSVNAIGTERLLKAIVQSDIKPKKIIAASSATVYGNQKSEILNESMIPKPNNHYALSKYSMELLCQNFYPLIPILITRPFNYTGLGHSENFLLPKLAKHYKEKCAFVELGNLNTYREYNNIFWVCDVYYQLAISHFHSEVVNIASSTTYSIKQIIEYFYSYTEHDIEIRVNPNLIRSNEIHELKGDTNKLSTMIYFNLEANSIKHTIQHLLSN